ncbi:hypothetical protein BpHYR1_042276 [Brachionus plicatilis]|uniref:Uncharacterized protein n=1 Tax=Brachionus plicatilis TaxID=10195 RepID=A0A3M7R4Z9_BRAPC|nr:hypothetical protein BpHYR1_042276 [Brachionus plicatilis]
MSLLKIKPDLFISHKKVVASKFLAVNLDLCGLLMQNMFLRKKINKKSSFTNRIKRSRLSRSKNEFFDSDNEQQEIVERGVAMSKVVLFLPNLLDACIIDAQNFFSFDFSVLNLVQGGLQFQNIQTGVVFEQSLFSLGSTDYKRDIVALIFVRPVRYHIFLFLNNFTYLDQMFLAKICELNSLNCLVAEFREPKDLNLVWLRHKMGQIGNY